MNWLIVENGVIDNIIIAEADVAETLGALPFYDGAAIGDEYAPPPLPPDPMADVYAMLIDHEFQITLNELGV
jgi:hypothetical protein